MISSASGYNLLASSKRTVNPASPNGHYFVTRPKTSKSSVARTVLPCTG